MMIKLTNIQKKKLMCQAHQRTPTVRIGNKQLTNALHIEIERTLVAHQLIKIKLPALDKSKRQGMIHKICQKHKATLINQIGFIGTFYRPKHKDSFR